MMQSNMKLTPQDSNITSSQEVDQPDQEATVDVATGRSYECVFCKRGFTTAQALGGHMNIHRKDRAKNRSNLNTNKNDHLETGVSRVSYQPIPSYQESRVNYRTYFPGSSGKGDFDHNAVFDKRFGLFGEDLRMGLNSKFDQEKNIMENKRIGSSEDDGLDLELRLGHDP